MEMKEKDIVLIPKQIQALRILNRPSTKELLYGGGAGGGKTYLLNIWFIMNCIKYPGTRWAMCREINKDIRASTLLTFYEVAKTIFGLTNDIDYKYRHQDSRIEFSNGSMIVLRELPHIPSDPNYDYLGSMEYTGGAIDEAQEIEKQARDILVSRFRYKLDEYNLTPTLLMTCNPGDGFLYDDFYSPFSKEIDLKKGRVFLPSLVTDNPKISKEYVKQLREMDDGPIKQRLLYGNWDYEESSNKLVLRQWLDNAQTDTYDPKGEKVGAVDPAREGGDETVVSIWVGKVLVHLEKIKVPIADNVDISGMIANEIIRIFAQWGIGYQNLHIDAIGIGAGVLDALRARGWYAKSYKGGSRAESREEFTEYENLRTYSYWKFRVDLQKGIIKILRSLPYKDDLFRELTAHEYEINDKMIKLCKKDQVKKKIGRSPDHSDATVMAYAPTCKNKFGFAI